MVTDLDSGAPGGDGGSDAGEVIVIGDSVKCNTGVEDDNIKDKAGSGWSTCVRRYPLSVG